MNDWNARLADAVESGEMEVTPSEMARIRSVAASVPDKPYNGGTFDAFAGIRLVLVDEKPPPAPRSWLRRLLDRMGVMG